MRAAFVEADPAEEDTAEVDGHDEQQRQERQDERELDHGLAAADAAASASGLDGNMLRQSAGDYVPESMGRTLQITLQGPAREPGPGQYWSYSPPALGSAGSRTVMARAGSELAVDVDRAAHRLHQAAGRVEADAAAVGRQAARLVGSVELVEGLAPGLLVHAGALVADRDRHGRAIRRDRRRRSGIRGGLYLTALSRTAHRTCSSRSGSATARCGAPSTCSVERPVGAEGAPTCARPAAERRRPPAAARRRRPRGGRRPAAGSTMRRSRSAWWAIASRSARAAAGTASLARARWPARRCW